MSTLVSTANLEGYWPFNAGDGKDASGHGRDLTTLLNLAFVPSVSGLGLSFADRSVARAAYGAAIDPSTWPGFSVSLWANKTAPTGASYAYLIDMETYNVGGFDIFTPNGTDSIQVGFMRAGQHDATPEFANAFEAAWHQYGLTFDLASRAWIIYRDGAELPGGSHGTLTNTPVLINKILTVGNLQNPAAATTWVGGQDEVRLYSVPLTAADMLNLFQNPGQIGDPLPAVAYGTPGMGRASRSLMKSRVTFERQFALPQDKDGFGQQTHDWRPLSTVPCLAWRSASGGRETTSDGVRTVTASMPGMIVPLHTDVTTLDRVQQITDRAGNVLFGPMGIDAVEPRSSHIELRLRNVG
jgi:hypothetical protein